MRILCTGIAGFLGSHIAERLLRDGHTVIGVDSLIGGERENVPEGTELYYDDCCDFAEMKEVCHGVDLVYHCAANPHEGLSVFSPTTVCKNTYLSTVAVCSAACASRVKRFCFMSSMSRYGNGFSLPFNERMLPMPVDPYGIAKVAAEATVSMLARTHGMEFVILVPHNVVGPRQKRDDPFRNVVAIMCNMMLQGRQPIIYGDGEQKRCFSFVGDAMDSIIKAGFQAGLSGDVINIGPDDEFITINELARKLAKIIGFDLHPVYVPERPCEVKHAYCSADKARRLLGYRTSMTLDDGLAEMVAWMREVGPRPFVYHLPLEIINDRTPKTWTERMM